MHTAFTATNCDAPGKRSYVNPTGRVRPYTNCQITLVFDVLEAGAAGGRGRPPFADPAQRVWPRDSGIRQATLLLVISPSPLQLCRRDVVRLVADRWLCAAAVTSRAARIDFVNSRQASRGMVAVVRGSVSRARVAQCFHHDVM
ncbi:hypothetical protein E2C01_044577 [Portunus trituberculatus]|uniref:Uncharacterized protein n=1 Tax=Portunus trituberculatus TaxID=210409 RepID=A0A5B7FZJ6_PORTR|nr:hypothetical protein [Portunus trituberculatus]